MNIGIDLRALTHSLTSGVTTYIRETVGALLRLDKQNRYFLWWNARHACPFDGKEFRQKNVTLVRTRESNTLLNLSLTLRRHPPLDVFIPTAVGKPNERLDVLWLPDPRPATVTKNCALVTTVHDLSPTKFPHFFSLKTRLWHALLNPAALACRSDHVLTPSKTVAAELTHEWGVYADQICITPLGVRDTFKRVTNAAVLEKTRKKYHLPRQFILALTTLEPRKNLNTLVRAFEFLKQKTRLPHTLVLAGSAHPKIFASTKLETKNWKLKTIFLPGFIDERDKAALYSAAAAFVSASVYEGFDLPVLEALTAGTPLIASDIPVHHEVAKNAARYFAPTNADALADMLADTLLNTAATKKYVTRGYARAKQFSWEATAKRTLAVIEKTRQRKT